MKDLTNISMGEIANTLSESIENFGFKAKEVMPEITSFDGITSNGVRFSLSLIGIVSPA